MNQLIRTYRVYTYDLWGNGSEGYEVNDVYRQATIIKLADTLTEGEINDRVSHELDCDVILDKHYDTSPGSTLYFTSPTNDCKPVCELRPT